MTTLSRSFVVRFSVGFSHCLFKEIEMIAIRVRYCPPRTIAAPALLPPTVATA
jgi:hypothetical protein